MVSRVSMMLEGVPDEMVGRDLRCFLRKTFKNPPKRHGVEDVDGVAGGAGGDDVDVVAGVNDAGRVLDGAWCSASAAAIERGERLRRQEFFFSQRGAVAQMR